MSAYKDLKTKIKEIEELFIEKTINFAIRMKNFEYKMREKQQEQKDFLKSLKNKNN